MINEQTRSILIFSLTLVVLCIIVSIFPYEYRDSDSSCYSAISQRLAFEPLSTWCAPQWWGHGGNQGLFREHPPGILWLPALLVRLGARPNVAALCANFIYLLLSLFFVYKLAGRWGGPILGWGVALGIILTPIFLQYLIRANQEPPLNLAVLAGIYGLARCQEDRRGGWIFMAALVLAVLIKGISVLLLSMLAGLFWLIVARNRRTFVLIVIGHLIVAAVMVLFELWYRGVAHQSFWQIYYSIQSARSLGGHFNLLRKGYNIAWYAARVLWFSAPWTIYLIYEAIVSPKKKFDFFRDSFVRYLFLGSLGIMVFFSFSDRKADRYIFPAYILLALVGVAAFLKVRPKIMDLLRRQERRLPMILSFLLVGLTFLRIFFHSHLYRFIRFWPQ
ncbi:MAG: glycosyltransferase family 39 protein [Candidatus Aminicenantes bacterium]|nr:glycosyltransferase family 39 protein [Candidatus Aminicenantes bacterium]